MSPLARKRWNSFRRIRRAWWSLIALGVIFVFCLCADFVCPYDPNAVVSVGRIRGVRCASILNNVVLYGQESADAVSDYASGESLTAIGEKREIEVALEAFLRLENK